MDKLMKVVNDIIELNIQGATNVAIEGVKAYYEYISRQSANQNIEDFKSKINNAQNLIINTRPTEPALQNGIKKINYELSKSDLDDIEEIKSLSVLSGKKYIDLIHKTKKQIIETGAELIQDGDTIMTHCHSSVSSAIIVKAFKDGKNINAICTETRPRYQGRKTAEELVSAGIPTVQVVDSAMRWVLRKKSIDKIIIGLDAITSEGTIFNKIGSRLLALAAKESDIPLYVAGSLLKYDTGTLLGGRTEIEMRDIDEITSDWKTIPKGLKFLNPSFETVSRDLIGALITEKGIFPPEIVSAVVKDTYKWM
tara:strand:- start:54 stop:983 length:930 start_codon:yes stop_codon:yes gene_type:complete